MSELIKNKKGVNTTLATLVVLGVTMAVPILGSGMASAAPESAWDKVAQCESGGVWDLPHGDRDSTGGLQFRVASWNDALAYLRGKGIDTSSYPSMPYQATKKQQIIAGEALLALQGPGAWTCNAMVGYPLQHTGANASMFKGGVNPFPVTTPPPSTPPPVTPKPTDPAPTAPPSAGDKYTVKKGDTLSGIATVKKVAGGWQVLYKANEKTLGSNPNLIFPGQVLVIPQPTVKYTVKSGDTLSGIAAKHKVAGGWQKLYEQNKSVVGDNPNAIKPGMVLTIQVGTSVSTPAPTPPAPSQPATKGYVSPLAAGTYVKGDNLIVGYGGSMSRSAGGHSGLDMTARQGTPVRSIAAGTVIHAGYGYAGAAYGNHVVVKHADGKYTLYAHLSANTVSTGATVTAGQMIGNVGSTGNSSGPHLHFEVRTDPKNFGAGIFLNPVTYLAANGVVL